jgi:hypothetical protein
MEAACRGVEASLGPMGDSAEAAKEGGPLEDADDSTRITDPYVPIVGPDGRSPPAA